MSEQGGGRSRIRIAHTKTAKNGWQHETSVEVEWPFGADDDVPAAAGRLARLLDLADGLGRQESARRAALDGTERGDAA